MEVKLSSIVRRGVAVDGPGRVCLALFAMLIAAFAVGLSLKVAMPEPYRVSVVYLMKSTLLLQSGTDSWGPMRQAFEYWTGHKDALLYSNVFFDQKIRFQYPPTALFISMWLGPVVKNAPHPAYTATLVVSLGAVWLASARILEIALERRGLVARRRVESLGLYLLVGALMMMFNPVLMAFNVGQLQLWLDALFALALLTWMQGRKAVAGALLGLVCLMKPQLAVFLPWALLRREWAFSIAMIAVGAIGLGASLLQFGLASNLDYLKVLSFLSQRGEAYYPNQSINGLVSRIVALWEPQNYSNLLFDIRGEFSPPNRLIYLATLSSSAVFLGLAILRPVRLRGDRVMDFCIMGLSATMASPIAWEHHYGVLFPIFAAMLPLCWGRPARMVVLAVCYLVVSQVFLIANALADTIWNFVQSYLFFGALAVLVMAYRLSLVPLDRPASAASPMQPQPA